MHEYFVTAGIDRQGTGTQSAPFATIERALAESRQAGCPATIVLQGGTHYLAEPIRLAASDRGLRIRAVAGEKAVISGGLRLELAWRPFRDGIWQANVPKGLAADQLFFNGERQIWARYPNFNPDERIFNGYAADCVSPERARRWMNPAGGYLHAMHAHLWGGFHFRITGKNPDETLEMEGGWQNNRQSGLHPDYRFVEGIFEELDGPGEWFLDQKSAILYYYPPDGVDLDSAIIEIPRLRHLVELTGSETEPVRDVAIQGITFRHTLRTFMDTCEPLLRSDWTLYRGGTVILAGCEDCRIDACDFVELGGNAVMVSGYNRRIMLSGCHIDRAGAGGISFVGLPRAVRNPLFEYGETLPVEALDRSPGPRSNDYPADCLVDDCLITRIGRVEKQAAGIQIAMAARIVVRHCSIHDVPRAGINISDGCWGGHVVEHCDVFNTVLETGDHGSFNSWGRDRYWHPDIEETDRRVASAPDLPLLDMVEPVTLRNSRWRCDHGWDIDLDDGSSHYLIENNLCLNGGIKLREGYRRVCRNNITVNSTLHLHCWFRNSGDILTRNIVFTEYQTTRVKQPWGEECDNNLLHLPGQAHTCAADKLRKLSGRDEHSLAGNAHFLAPDSGDYRVHPESPAWALGFVNFPMDRFGVRSPRLRALAATPELPVITSDMHSPRPDGAGVSGRDEEIGPIMTTKSTPDRTSRVPHFSFADTLEAQEAQLVENPLMLRFRESRRALSKDPHRPLYHFVNPESLLNDPNGLCFWRGRWHLFYQGYPPEDSRQHWGHAVSDDLIHWRDLPYAIYPNPEDCCFSGATLVEADRVIAMYHGTQAGNMVAVSRDPLLLNWEKLSGQAVVAPTAAPTVFDPCIWKKDRFYYSLSGGTQAYGPAGLRFPAEYLLRSRDLVNWEYLHPFVEGDAFSLVGDDGACPYFWPIGDRHILLHFSHMSGAHYLLGDYDKARDKFVVTAGGRFTFGAYCPGGVHAPSATPDGKGGVIVLFNINGAKPTTGWDQIMSLPRRLTLAGRDQLAIEPAGAVETLRGVHRHLGEMTLPANREVVLDGVHGNALEIVAEIDPQQSPMVELNVLRSPDREEFTRIAFFKGRGYQEWGRFAGWDKWFETCDSLVTLDTGYSSELPDVTSRAPETAPVYLVPGETVKLRVFIDKSVVEVFVNGRQCVAARVYPGRADSLGVSLRAQGAPAKLLALDAWQMKLK